MGFYIGVILWTYKSPYIGSMSFVGLLEIMTPVYILQILEGGRS